jgi:hypothetical protein
MMAIQTNPLPAVANWLLLLSKPQRSHVPSTMDDNRSRVLAAPGLLEQNYQVVRDEDDSDEGYEQRRAFFALVIDAARRP